MNKIDWRDFSFYKAAIGATCCVCGSNHEIGIEPRFAYYICELHKDIPPVDISSE